MYANDTKPINTRLGSAQAGLSRLMSAAALAMAGALIAPAAMAQANWAPDKPIRMVVPYPPGGGSDSVARSVTDALSAKLGQPIVVENRSGANGAIGTQYVFNAPPDGYTLLMSSADTYSMYPPLYPKAGFVSEEFIAVAPAAKINFAIMSRGDLPAKNLDELIALAKKKQLTFGTWGHGSGAHIVMGLFTSTAKIPDMLHVPYQGAAPVVQAAMAGQVDLVALPATLALSYRERLRSYGFASRERLQALPEVPTFSEQGLPLLADAWVGIIAPPKTPAHITATVAKAMNEVMADPGLQKKLNDLGIVPFSATQDEFAAYLKKDYEFWGKTIRDAGIKIEN